MTTIEIFKSLNVLVTVTADAIILFSIYPAFKATRNRGFLFLIFAFLLALFDTISDATLGRLPMTRGAYYAYFSLRELTHYLDVILMTTGLLLLTKSFLALFPGTAPKSNVQA